MRTTVIKNNKYWRSGGPEHHLNSSFSHQSKRITKVKSRVFVLKVVWWPSELICFVLAHICLRYPVIGTYRSWLWAVLHNERILRDIKNLINVSLFSLFLVCLLYIYRCFAVLKINWIITCEKRPKGRSLNWYPVKINWIITCEDNKQLRWFWDSFAHELTKLVLTKVATSGPHLNFLWT